MFRIGEVIEIKKAFKSGQSDDEGNHLPLGSIKCRVGGDRRISGNIRHIWARPAIFNRRIPLQYEQVLLFLAPAHDQTDGISKTNEYYYIAPINATDDLVLHQLPKTWWRRKGSGPGGGQGPTPPGMTFPPNPKKVDNIQPFAGDDVIESRFGSSIRLGQSVTGGQYDNQPTWKGGSNGDPITIFRIKKPSGGGGGSASYTIEDLGEDDASIYMTSTQKLLNISLGFTKHLDGNTAPAFSKPQILVDAERVIINAKKDMAMLIGKNKSIVAGKQVLFVSDKYFVDLDELVEYIKDILTQLNALTSGQKNFATPAGPTAIATNMADVVKLLNVDFNTKFKTPK